MALRRDGEWEPRAQATQPQAPAAPTPPTLQPPANYRPVPPMPQPPTSYGQPGYGQMPARPQAPSATQPQVYGGSYARSPYAWQPTQEFSDPTTANFENLLNFQTQGYMQPVYDPARNQYGGMLQNMIGSLSPQNQQFQQYMSVLQSILGEAGGASPGEGMLMSLAGSLAGGGNADAYANEYRNQLKADPYTGAEFETYRTAALEPIENDRAAAQDAALRRISQQGIDPSSGIALAMQNEIDNAAMQARAGAQNQLGMKRVEDRVQRQGMAFDAGMSAEQLKMQGRSAAVGAASGANNAWYNRQGLRAGTAGDLANALPSRLAAQLQPAQALSGLSQTARGEQDARYSQAISLAQMLANLPAQRQQEALQAMGAGQQPGQVMDSLGQISGMNFNNQQASNLSNFNLQQGLGSLLGYLGPLFNPTGTTSGGGGGYMPGNVSWPKF